MSQEAKRPQDSGVETNLHLDLVHMVCGFLLEDLITIGTREAQQLVARAIA